MTMHDEHDAGDRALPARQGLYDPALEHDACGVGFVAHVRGERSHALVADALQLLDNLSHRSAVGADADTGDGAGMLLQLPHAFLREECTAVGFRLPDAGRYGVGMIFLPQDTNARAAAEEAAARVTREDGWRLLGWRDVPVVPAHLGGQARERMPCIRQLFVDRPGLEKEPEDPGALERALYVLRRRLERAWRAMGDAGRECYVASLSSRTIVYKGMLRPGQVGLFYPDLRNPAMISSLAIVHSRFSTNTFPAWALAHPYRFVAHNGEINTIRGNINWMRVREPELASPKFGKALPDLLPVVREGQSDSASFDNVLELLVMGGRPLGEALMMMIPEAWEGDAEMPADRRAFYEHHASLMEPWDGPAAIVVTDGRQVGAVLDRNGLRPARYAVTHEDMIVLASEAGALAIPPERIRTKGRLRPGQMLLVNTTQGRIVDDAELKSDVASLRPYRRLVSEQQLRLPVAHDTAAMEATRLRFLQRAFGYTREELRMVLGPMATAGEEPVGSMGNDTPIAAIAEHPQLLFSYFRQRFAQVTNPAIDPIRERLVMSLRTQLGPQANLLAETLEHPRQLVLDQPLLGEGELEALAQLDEAGLRATTLPTAWQESDGAGAMALALDRLCRQAADAVREGAGILILSDRQVDEDWASIPSLLAVSAVHHHLGRAGLRGRVSLLADAGDAREVSHIALLIGHGAAAVCPWLALQTVATLGDDAVAARAKYVKAIGKGLLKILSKMGISTLQSYCGAQVFEAVGIDRDVMARHFSGTPSRLGGVGLEVLAGEVLARHEAARRAREDAMLAEGSDYYYRARGTPHAWNPQTIATLQHAVRQGSFATFREFSRIANEESASHTLRGLLDFAECAPIPLAEVEPVSAIVKRFVTGAMSFGSLGREAHETLAIAMNRLQGRSNTGEGGEERGRFGTERNSAIKQVASGRFGVTTEYLVNASELQIKIAQGAKPGEGGQLPGHKVDEVIARTRCSMPGVTLISPPPHHDIYSIEDLAQLIFDLKMVNPRAAVSVKLVSEAGVGTIAAGVAKAHADLICISGDAGGTGASPLSSIKHAGVPWELGLAETQQTLLLNGLRDRVRLQTDGQLKTGRDVVIAAILGAEEFGFATAPLIAEGCVMMRKCHLNTCPVGIATQDPELRAKFTGAPEHVVNYFFFVAEEVRELMARLGVRCVDDLVGRVELLRARAGRTGTKARALDLSELLHLPARAAGSARRCVRAQAHGLEQALDQRLVQLATPALESGAQVRHELPITNVDRAVGAMVSGEIARRYGAAGLPEDTIRIRFGGSAGQSFGAFAARGLTLELVGEANDYVGKGLSGGRLIVRPPKGVRYLPEETVIIGNTVLYGATGGEAYFCGVGGQRFAVRNSGATAVVEGVGDHGCEYMTGGMVVVLGRTGRNFGAGMSGGLAFVHDPLGELAARCNGEMVEVEAVGSEHGHHLKRLIEQHAKLTGSGRARHLLAHWERSVREFATVIPREFRRALEREGAATQSQLRVLGEVRHG